MLTFYHQTVYDPRTRSMVPLHPVPATAAVSEMRLSPTQDLCAAMSSDEEVLQELWTLVRSVSGDDVSFLGPMDPRSFVCEEIAAGRMDPTTKVTTSRSCVLWVTMGVGTLCVSCSSSSSASCSVASLSRDTASSSPTTLRAHHHGSSGG